MKKIIISSLLACISLGAMAVNFGVTAGLNATSIKYDDAKTRVGFNVGFKLNENIGTNGFIEESLLLSKKGYTLDNKATAEIFNSRLTIDGNDTDVDLYYLDLPVYAGYNFAITSNFSIAPKGGIYLSCGLFGDDGNDNNPFSECDVEVLGKKYDYNLKRFDMGLGLGVNFNLFHHFQISSGYNWGLYDFSSEDDSNSDFKTRHFYANFAYFF